MPRASLFGVLVAAAVAGCVESPLQRRDAGTGVGDGSAQGTDQKQLADGAPEQVTLPADPGRIGLHFLTNTEYDNTVKDLLGVTASPASGFPTNDRLGGFDNNSEVRAMMVAARYEHFFVAADSLSAQVFSSEALRARIVPCTPTQGLEAACAKDTIRAFGLRAWRRTLAEAEVERLFTVFATARGGGGEDFLGAMRQAVRAALSSFPFLYHVELDDQPASPAVHPLTPYELASRLSYLLWRTMPDDRLFALAASGELGRDDVLLAQVERMLNDRRSMALVRALADGWLGAAAVRERQFDPRMFPSWDEPLREAILEEAYLYVSEFLLPDRRFTEFLTADINYVNARLAQHYGFPAPAGTDFVRVEEPSDQRKGYLGLAAFLSGTSLPTRTSPTYRGISILEDVLCDPLPPPPPDIPVLPPDPNPPGTFRQQVEQISAEKLCAACHKLSDPIGLGLENFDPIGRHRTSYPNGDAVDLSGLAFAGKPFVGLLELANLLAQDPRFLKCAPKQLFTYALRRRPDQAGDQLRVQHLQGGWSGQGLTLRSLIKDIVASAAFRFRRGEAN